MSRIKQTMLRRAMVGAGLSVLAVGAVMACGGYFSVAMLSNRVEALRSTPANTFVYEVTHLLPATAALQSAEPSVPKSSSDGEHAAQDTAARLGLTGPQAEQVAELRKSSDSGIQGYENGKGLPEDVRLYTAAAIDYGLSQQNLEGGTCDIGDEWHISETEFHACTQPDVDAGSRAKAYFAAVLALPPEQAKLRSAWAAYMLGTLHGYRALNADLDADQLKQEREAASKFFELARTRAMAGASDTQGLAIASYGEQARLHLYNGTKYCSWGDLYNGNDCADGIAPADLKQAIALYAQQAANSSDIGVQSLRVIASWALKDRKRVDALVDDPLAQRLLVIYALARVGDIREDSPDSADEYPALDAAVGAKGVKVNPVLTTLIEALDAHGLAHVEAADRLAALAYRTGRYDLAARMADKQTTPLASWVRAKLALQKGDLAAASAAYADAVKGFPVQATDMGSVEASNVSMVRGERGVLAVARGEYIEALGYLHDTALGHAASGIEGYDGDRDYEGDAIYLAERVLTVDELKSFVDGHASDKTSSSTTDASGASLNASLRQALARRLMREGRYDEAMPYFPATKAPALDAKTMPSTDTNAQTRKAAEDFAAAMKHAEGAWRRTDRARYLFAAAQIARDQGESILGYDEWRNEMFNLRMSDTGNDQTYWGSDEAKRLHASGGMRIPNEQYAYIATDLAWRAADALPPRSQAFAATLCTASGWMIYANHYVYGAEKDRAERIQKIYRRYVKEGPHVDWAEDFGRQCEAPDFDAAELMVRAQYMAQAKHWIRVSLPYLAGAVVLMGAWVIVAWRRRRRTVADKTVAG
jgi:hypothetical protein